MNALCGNRDVFNSVLTYPHPKSPVVEAVDLFHLVCIYTCQIV